jgi:very-short-patch-repair endonuclease
MVEGRLRDFYWHDQRLVVETDGRGEHLTPIAFEDDRERDVLLMEAGYRVRRFTYRQITERPAWVAARIRAALGP